MQSPPSKPNAIQRTVLIVDDEAEIREALAEILTGAKTPGCNRRASGAKHLERMAAERFDVILTDIRMPDLDGRALYQEIERRWPGQGRARRFRDRRYPGLGIARVCLRERPPGD